MDPLEDLCTVKDSFLTDKNIRNINISKYHEEYYGSPRVRRENLLSNKKLEIIKLPQLKEINIEGRFSRHSSYILANIDMIYNFTKQENGYLVLQVINDNFKYTILGGDIGFLNYMQYRLPDSLAITPCIKSETKIDLPYNNLNMNCDNGIVKYVNDITPEGVDVVLSNLKDINIDALKICKKGGVLINRIEEINLEKLYLLTLCFQKFSLFHPFLSSHVYAIGEDFSGNTLDIIPLFSQNISVPHSFIIYIQNFISNLTSSDKEYNLYRCKALMNIE